MCHLQYVNDLIILITGGKEDLQIKKIILYSFEVISRLGINSQKTYLVSTWVDQSPKTSLTSTLCCSFGSLSMTYLDMPINGRGHPHHDQEQLIFMIRQQLSPWKSKLLAIGGKLTLVNLVLFAILTYWMSIFKLPGFDHYQRK